MLPFIIVYSFNFAFLLFLLQIILNVLQTDLLCAQRTKYLRFNYSRRCSELNGKNNNKQISEEFQ